MRVELHKPDEPDDVLAVVTWEGRSASVSTDDPQIAEKLRRCYRLSPVAVDDAAYRSLAAHGPVVYPPGTLEWFRAVTQSRVPDETGLVPRFVPGVKEGGFDPAAGYRPFGEVIARLVDRVPEP
jgi:hypothetical protein